MKLQRMYCPVQTLSFQCTQAVASTPEFQSSVHLSDACTPQSAAPVHLPAQSSCSHCGFCHNQHQHLGLQCGFCHNKHHDSSCAVDNPCSRSPICRTNSSSDHPQCC
uniref:Uncharacterized protein n=1 Tax=Arundo donax TaxID=35708 RepID=A0A0A9CQI9_ARUDO